MNQSEKKTAKRKLFTSALCLLLLLIMLLSSTLAWFTDSKSYVNTMVAGKVNIEQTEDFTQDTMILPNVSIPKDVVVKNVGNTPCYVRTLFAFEDSNEVDILPLLILEVGESAIEIPGLTNGEKKIQFTVTKDDKTTLYTVGYYIHADQLEVGGSINPLKSIMLTGRAGNEWHKAVGEKYEIFVLSQACQVAGLDNLGSSAAALDTAFEPITSDWCATWFGKMLTGNSYGHTAVAAVNP